MKDIDKLVAEFNKLDSCVKLKLESGGIARINVVDEMVMSGSKIVPSEKFFDKLQEIATNLGIIFVVNSMQTTVRVEKR